MSEPLSREVEERIAAIARLGQHGSIPLYWARPIALALADDAVRLARSEARVAELEKELAAWMEVERRDGRLQARAQKAERRVAELEKERDTLTETLRLREESQIPVIPRAAKARLDRAEAGLAAAQEALKASVGFWIATPDELLVAPLSPAEHERLLLVRDALARGGGQQETG